MNTPLAGLYRTFIDMPAAVSIGPFGLDKPLLLWINDGLMAVFFLLVALEIKRELVGGQLQTRAQRMLPMVCAAAGVVVPALIFAAFNHDNAAAMRGWAVPTATDIAFALGVLALLGSRVPIGMKLLLSTIAVVDDLIAIVIIAVFYSHGMSFLALGGAGVTLAAMFAMNRMGVKSLTPYLVLGLVLWVCVMQSGVHATLAGVATGLLIPHVDKRNMIDDEIEHSPLETLEHALHPWVAFAILPIFAFANAGLELRGLNLSQALPRCRSAWRGPGRRQADRHLRRGVGAAQARMGALSRRHGRARDARPRRVVRHRLHDEPVHRLARVSSIRFFTTKPCSASSSPPCFRIAGRGMAARGVAGALTCDTR